MIKISPQLFHFMNEYFTVCSWLALLVQSGIPLLWKIFCIFFCWWCWQDKNAALFVWVWLDVSLQGVVQVESSIDGCPGQLTLAYFCVDLLS